ncbi:MAG: hypothetical protein ACYS1C_12175, partial [Planctomycetota bacterium]
GEGLATMGGVTDRRRLAIALTGALVLAACMSAGAAGAAGRPESLPQASDRAAELLRSGVTGEPTQRLQQQILDELDRLIAEARLKPAPPAGGPGTGGKAKMEQPGAGAGKPRKPAEESVLPTGEWQRGRLREAVEPDRAWLPELPAAERKRIADAFSSGRLPRRYRDLLRHYNRRLAEGEGGGP